jgi:hypothetical protein
MKFNRLSAFLVGVVTTAASVGAVSYVDASGSSTIQACADKRTGVMRLISRGSCKRTETKVSWNVQGPQGLPGPTGARGETGATGAKGESGANATSPRVVDANGKLIGPVLGDGVSSRATPAFLVLVDGRLWSMSSSEYEIRGTAGYGPFYSDSSCTSPVAAIGPTSTVSSQLTHVIDSKYFAVSGTYAAADNLSRPVYWDGPTCELMSLTNSPSYSGDRPARADLLFVTLTEVTAPVYTAPLSVVLG